MIQLYTIYGIHTLKSQTRFRVTDANRLKMNDGKRHNHAKSNNQGRAEVVILISDEIDYKTKIIT